MDNIIEKHCCAAEHMASTISHYERHGYNLIHRNHIGNSVELTFKVTFKKRLEIYKLKILWNLFGEFKIFYWWAAIVLSIVFAFYGSIFAFIVLAIRYFIKHT